MSTVTVISLGLLTWVLFAILLALFVARMIQLRDRQRPPAAAGEGDQTRSASQRTRTRVNLSR